MTRASLGLNGIRVCLLLAFAGVASAGLSITVPEQVVECVPSVLRWTSTTPPYYLQARCVLRDNSTSEVQIFNAIEETEVVWTPSFLLAGCIHTFLDLSDSATGNVESPEFNVQYGSTTLCSGGLAGTIIVYRWKAYYLLL